MVPRPRLRRLTRGLTAEVSELDADEIAAAVRAEHGRAAAELVPGTIVTVTGRIRALETAPRALPAVLTAELWDGTEAVDVLWLGRRAVPGIEPGRWLTVRGRLGLRAGRKVLYNPDYALGDH